MTAISTLGFRGEALASVSAVARVSLITKTADSEFGTSYKVEGGIESEHEQAGCPDGTTLIVRDLFFNTPARLKFLKKDVSEGNAVQSVVDKAALINPHIAFRFIRDNKLVRVTPGDGKMYSAIYAVFGKSFAASMIPVERSHNGVTVSGYVSRPLFCKNNRAYQHFYVNSRNVKSGTCSAALEEAYRNCIMTGKFPACVLNVVVNPSDVDANVHPTKTEVRFADERAIFSAVHVAVKNAILNDVKDVSNASDVSVADDVVKDVTVDRHAEVPYEPLRIVNGNCAVLTAENTVLSTSVTSKHSLVLNSPKREYVVSTAAANTVANAAMPYEFKHINADSFTKRASQPETESLRIVSAKHEPYRFIGELFSTYIMCEQGEELVLIDKHAADERIRFNKLKAELKAHSQLLLESLQIELDIESCTRLIESAAALSQIGLSIEQGSSQQSVVVTGFPSLIDPSKAEELLVDIAETICGGGNVELESLEIIDELMHRAACRSAIKAGDKSPVSDMEELANLILTADGEQSLQYCPHGRPIMVRIPKRDFEKKFKRVL